MIRNLIFTIIIGLVIVSSSCNEKAVLQEIPLSALGTEVVLSSEAGFDNYLTGLYFSARDELMTRKDRNFYYFMNVGTDVACAGILSWRDTDNYETSLTPSAAIVGFYWTWAYGEMIQRANIIIANANRSDNAGMWSSQKKKNEVIAQARFFRGYTYNVLANLFGGVPIVDTVYGYPKTDFVRSTRAEVYDFAKEDLEFASTWLPATVPANQEGRIVKAAADHLLSEVYISLGNYPKAIESASRVIESGLYRLMTERFGSAKGRDGDVFSDMFKLNNQNRRSGNLESIYVWQFEDQTPGGAGTAGYKNILRVWAPFYVNLRDPLGNTGMIVVDSLGRSVGGCRPTNYLVYDIWEDNWDNDMRNSPYNIRRVWYYNNPASPYFGQQVEKKTTETDTMQNIFPSIRKVEGVRGATTNIADGSTIEDFIVYRLAETYLLRAEAHFRNSDLQGAADDLNTIRARAGAKPVLPAQVSLDYILDERARELIAEEPRKRTLMRMGKLVERVKKYNISAVTRNTISEKHELWPIPQSEIDANFSAILEQNPGY